jgi:hypothetical protein
MNTSSRDPDTTLAAWLDEGPTELPESVRRSIATATQTTTQRRRGLGLPWRFFTMNGYARLAFVAATVMVVAVGGLYLIGLTKPPGVGGPPGSPTPLPTAPATPAPAAAGTITLTDSGCTWESNPGSLAMPAVLGIAVRNDTDHYADFQLHWVRTGHTYAEGVAFVADVQRRLTTGDAWPPNDISISVEAQGVPAHDDATVGWATAGIGEGPVPEFRSGPNWRWEPGSYGVVCSANTSSTGDILTTFLVGPLQLTEAAPSPSP